MKWVIDHWPTLTSIAVLIGYLWQRSINMKIWLDSVDSQLQSISSRLDHIEEKIGL